MFIMVLIYIRKNGLKLIKPEDMKVGERTNRKYQKYIDMKEGGSNVN